MNYKNYLNSSDWKLKRKAKLATTRRCAICGSEENIDIHHLIYKDLFNVERKDLRVLCRRCHFLTHDLFDKGLIKFNSTNHNSRFTLIKTAVKKYLGISNIPMHDIVFMKKQPKLF